MQALRSFLQQKGVIPMWITPFFQSDITLQLTTSQVHHLGPTQQTVLFHI